MSLRAIASGGGTAIPSISPREIAASSERSNHRTSSSSPSLTVGSPPAWRAKKPSMSEAGKGHGCDER